VLLFRQLMTGQMRIDLGLRDGLAEAAKQAATSFVCFCIFRRLLPVQLTIEGAPGKVAKKAGKPAVDPEVLRRFSLLVEEAKRRVEAHRGSSGRGLRRTFSEGTFATPSSPKTPLPRGRLGGNGGLLRPRRTSARAEPFPAAAEAASRIPSWTYAWRGRPPRPTSYSPS